MVHDPDLVSLQEVRSKVEKAWAAFQKYRTFTQEQVDAVIEAAAAAGRANARRLAEMAVEETGYGNVKDKIAKNLLNADLLPRAMRGMKTVGLLKEIPEQRVIEYGVPVGVVAAIVPTTNPTSTVIYKVLICLKAGNAIVISPHPRARKCTCETAELLHEAAVKAGAAEGLVQCITSSSVDATRELMHHRRVSVILSTGGSGIVRAAYSSGKPAFGVGPGNVPVFIDRTANIHEAVGQVVEGKAFDYGTVCSSEQALVAEQPLRATVLGELKARKASLCNEQQKQALEKLLVLPGFKINPDCVGQAPGKIARMAGFEVPPDTSILCVELEGVGKEHPLSMEKLSPVLALFFPKDFAGALDTCEAVLRFGGLGHTCVIYSKDESRVREFAERMPAFRVLVNTPAPHGSVGITTNLMPSMTLGCGAMGGNITGDNVGPQHLINIKRLAWAVRKPEEALDLSAVEAAAPAQPALAGAAARSVDRPTVLAAVEKYLAERGISTSPAAAAPVQPTPPAPAPAPVRTGTLANVAAEVVDRFLATRAGRQPAPEPAASAPSCACAGTTAPGPPAPDIVVVDFVSETDVRQALRDSRKIYIGPKTIVTPAARDLAAQYDILVLTQR